MSNKEADAWFEKELKRKVKSITMTDKEGESFELKFPEAISVEEAMRRGIRALQEKETVSKQLVDPNLLG